MSKELKNIKQTVMEKIHHGDIKMRPKWYFVLGSLFAFLGLVASMVTSVFLFGLIRFSLRSHGPMGEYRLEQLLANFPWWTALIAVAGLGIGIWLLRRYDFSYKVNFWWVTALFIVAMVATGWILDMTGLNDTLLHRGPMQGMMRQYFEENGSWPGQGFRGRGIMEHY